MITSRPLTIGPTWIELHSNKGLKHIWIPTRHIMQLSGYKFNIYIYFRMSTYLIPLKALFSILLFVISMLVQFGSKYVIHMSGAHIYIHSVKKQTSQVIIVSDLLLVLLIGHQDGFKK
jgi:hypothetical protein